MSDLISDFYRQNEWANLAVLDACRGLTEEQLDTPAEGTFGSIRDTLLHFIGSEGGYATQLGHEPSPRLLRDAPWPGFDALAEMASAAANSLVAAAQEASDRIHRVGSENKWDVEAAVVLVQAFHHSTEHRSQICTVLTTLGLEPPDLSSWAWGIAVEKMRAVP